jgi:predicted DNA-binding transcriptional regulator AlpA
MQRRLSPSGFRPIPRRGFSRTEAAIYVGVSPTKFDQMIVDGRMPKPRRIDARRVWDIRELDEAFDALSGGEEYMTRNPWDDVLAPGGDALESPKNFVPPIVFKKYAPGEWEKEVCASPLGKRELAGLGAYYDARNEKLSYIKGAGINTTERLEARGFIFVAEKRGDRVSYYRIIPEGEAAWLRLQKS